jgi:hypothetical protein
MQLVGFSVDGSSASGGMNGSLSLPGVSVIIGQNGLGKTRILEGVASALQGRTGWGRQSPYGDLGHEGLAWLQVELAPRGNENDWAWLRELTRMNPGPPGHAVEGGVGFRRPGCEVPASEGETFAAWAPRVAEHVGGARHAHVALVSALLEHPIIDVMNVEQGDVTLGFVPARLGDDVRSLALALLETEDEREQKILLSCLDTTTDFVPLLELGEFPPSDPEPWQPPLPQPIFVSTESADLDVEAEDILVTILGGGLERTNPAAYLHHRQPSTAGPRRLDRWFVQFDDQVDLDPAIPVALRALQELTNDLAPEFVTRGVEIEISIYPIELWNTGLPRINVSAVPDGSDTYIAGTLLGAGSRRWVLAALREAGRRLADGHVEAPGVEPEPDGFEARSQRHQSLERAIREGDVMIAPTVTPALYIVDEPELHLHPLAVNEVASWLRARADEGSQVLAATHSPNFLARSTGSAVGVLVAGEDGLALREVSETGLAALEELAPELGLDRSVWLQMTRAVVVVEGQHDLMVIERFFGDELERHAIRLLALRGTKNTRRFIESEFLGQAGIPLRVVFDNVRSEALEGQVDPSSFRDEERDILQLLHQLSQGHDIRAFPFEGPDIMCALPEDAVRRAFPDARFEGWEGLVLEWRGMKARENFKNFARRRMGIESEVSSDLFVETVLKRVRADEIPGFGLKGAMVALIDSVVPWASH